MRSLTLLSGGMDSSVALALEAEAGRAAYALSLAYGAKHNAREREFARKIAWKYDVQLLCADLPLLAGSSLTGVGALVGATTVVPGRNLILASMGAHWAKLYDCDWLVLGCNQNDHQTYPDCRGAVWDAFNEALFACESGVRVHLPFRGRSKQWIAAEAGRLGLDLNMTYSCYAGRDEPCGQCGACIERNAALGFAVV